MKCSILLSIIQSEIQNDNFQKIKKGWGESGGYESYEHELD